MTALVEPSLPLLVDLRQAKPDLLEPLLAEEVELWAANLDWDFRASAELILRFIRMQSLSGYALLDGERAIGYCYYVQEDEKGLIGDVFVGRREIGAGDHEVRLMAAALRALAATPFVRRVEAQFMMLSRAARARMPFPGLMKHFERLFMTAGIGRLRQLPAGPGAVRAEYYTWHEREMDAAARLMSAAYARHVDSKINNQYGSPAGARKFIANILEYPGCGSFFEAGSVVALDIATGRLIGVCLASLVAFDVGHVTQVCVAPEVRGSGIGYEMLRRSIAAMERHGCRAVSLTVTAANVDAVRMYERMGFATRRVYEAFVWDGVGK